MKRAAIPLDTREFPDYEYREFPKWLGRDEFGQDLIANTAADVEALEVRKVYPKLLGLDVKGNKVEALHPDEVAIKKTWVTRQATDVAETGNRLAAPKADAEKAALEDENARLRKELEEARAAGVTPEPKPGKQKKAA